MQAMFGEPAVTPAPAVSVLMTTWNGAAFIAATIASVLAQDFKDFELIVVDDASTDATPAVLAGMSDPRLRVVRREVNGGVVAARNVGFALARGRYLAALDHDDLSRPGRLGAQVRYLDTHPDVVLVGTEITIENAGRRAAPDHVRGGDPMLMRWLLHVDNPLTWSSVMLRVDAVRRLGAFVRAEYELADDFDLYHRLLTVGEIARLDEVLTVYRWHATNTTYGREDALNDAAVRVLTRTYARLLGDDAEDAATLVIRHLSDRKPVRDAATLVRLGGYLTRLLEAFCAGQRVDARARQELAMMAGMIWWRCVRAAVRSGAPRLLGIYRGAAPLARGFRPGWAAMGMSVVVGAARAMGGRGATLVRAETKQL
jgi:glycosyltransferase involved in cell wall biosynthesis